MTVREELIVNNIRGKLSVSNRDGPLEKLGGGGRGIFEPQEFFLGHSMNIF